MGGRTMTPANGGYQALDLEDALAKVGGDRDLLIELAGLFCKEHSNTIAALRKAVADRDGPAVRSAAHILKGSLAVFRAKHAIDLAAHLEDSARAGQLAGTDEMFSDLEVETQKVRAALEQLGSTGTAQNDGLQPEADGKELS